MNDDPGHEAAGRASCALLELRHISKAFPGVQALDHVDFSIRRGEVHALMGENGAGKSTLIKVLTGVYRRDAGEMLMDGLPIDPRSPQEAQALGISTVYQEVNLIPHLSVAENICLGRQPMQFGRIDWKEIRRRAQSALARLGLRLDVRQPLASCSIAIQQLIAVARALDISAKLLILDEPTSSLDEKEVAQLFAILRQLKADALGIVFVTHFLNQAYAVSDRITVLRNGQFAGTDDAASLSRLELIARMLGKEVKELEMKSHRASTKRYRDKPEVGPSFPLTPALCPGERENPLPTGDRTEAHGLAKKSAAGFPLPWGEGQGEGKKALQHAADSAATASRKPFLAVRGLGRKGAIAPFDLKVAPGEVIGLAGLLGSGRTEMARLLFGLDRADAGEVRCDGQPLALTSPRRAIREGFGFCPEDRKTQAIIPDLSVRENIILALQASKGWVRALAPRQQAELAANYIKALNIATPDPDQPIKFLSGGNQQKAILARWLASQPRFLILDEPTRGIDVGAKFEIARLMEQLAGEGMAILFISSELEEVVRSSHRVVVLCDRAKIRELTGEEITEANVMHTIAEARDENSKSQTPSSN